MHLTSRININGGLFADQSLGIEIDKSDEINLSNVRFVGLSNDYRRLIDDQGADFCPQGRITGIEHHTWRNAVSFVSCFLTL